MTSKDKTTSYGGMKPNAFDRYLQNPDPPGCDDGSTHHCAGMHGKHELTGKVLNAMMQPSNELQSNFDLQTLIKSKIAAYENQRKMLEAQELEILVELKKLLPLVKK